jgi:hypothetical protein
MFEIFGHAIFVIEKIEEHFMETKCFFLNQLFLVMSEDL